MANLTPEEYAKKWSDQMTQASKTMLNGANRVKVAPGISAGLKEAKMRANILQAIDDGTWRKAVESVSLEDWRKKYIDLGIRRVPAGAQAAQPKMEAFATKLLPAIATAKAAIANLADITLEDNILRMSTFVREMANFQYKKNK